MSLLLVEQAVFDKQEFDPDEGYRTLTTKEAKARHILEHCVKAAGKLAVGERSKITNEVIPDLAIYRSQIINLFRLGYLDILKYKPVKPDENYANRDNFLHDQKDKLAMANAGLATYIEKKEHYGPSDGVNRHTIHAAARGLHVVAANLAVAYEIDLEMAHRNRMVQLLGEPLPDPLV